MTAPPADRPLPPDDSVNRLENDFVHGLLCKPGRQVVMFELPLPPLYERFGRIQRELAARHGVSLIPKRVLLSVIEATESTVDTIHLTQEGHDRMAAVVWSLLGPAMTTDPQPVQGPLIETNPPLSRDEVGGTE